MNESRSRSWILQHVWAGFPPRTCIIHDISDFRYTCRRVQLPLTKYQFCCCNKNTISTKTRTTGGIDKNVISSRQRWIVKFIWELQSHEERCYFFNNSSLGIRECGVFIPVRCERGIAQLQRGDFIEFVRCIVPSSHARTHSHWSLSERPQFLFMYKLFAAKSGGFEARRAFSLRIYVARVQKKWLPGSSDGINFWCLLTANMFCREVCALVKICKWNFPHTANGYKSAIEQT